MAVPFPFTLCSFPSAPFCSFSLLTVYTRPEPALGKDTGLKKGEIAAEAATAQGITMDNVHCGNAFVENF